MNWVKLLPAPVLPKAMSDPNLPENIPPRIVVELLSSADVKRLEDRDEDLRKEIKQLEQRIEGLHRHIYELMEAIGKLRSKRS